MMTLNSGFLLLSGEGKDDMFMEHTEHLEWDAEDTASPGLSTRPKDFSVKALTGGRKQISLITPV